MANLQIVQYAHYWTTAITFTMSTPTSRSLNLAFVVWSDKDHY